MQRFNINPLLLNKEVMKEIIQEAQGRVDQQLADCKRGNKKASYSYGKKNEINIRTPERRLEDSFIGCIAEYMGSSLTKCPWEKQRKQYDGNDKADLYAIYKGKKTAIEVRGTRMINNIIYRCSSLGEGKDFGKDSNTLLFAVSNLPKGPVCKVGYLTFGELNRLSKKNQSWYVSGGIGTPYYKVPIGKFNFNSDDFT